MYYAIFKFRYYRYLIHFLYQTISLIFIHVISHNKNFGFYISGIWDSWDKIWKKCFSLTPKCHIPISIPIQHSFRWVKNSFCHFKHQFSVTNYCNLITEGKICHAEKRRHHPHLKLKKTALALESNCDFTFVTVEFPRVLN